MTRTRRRGILALLMKRRAIIKAASYWSVALLRGRPVSQTHRVTFYSSGFITRTRSQEKETRVRMSHELIWFGLERSDCVCSFNGRRFWLFFEGFVGFRIERLKGQDGGFQVHQKTRDFFLVSFPFLGHLDPFSQHPPPSEDEPAPALQNKNKYKMLSSAHNK